MFLVSSSPVFVFTVDCLTHHAYGCLLKSESEVAQSCPTLSDPMDCSPPGSSVRGIFQARVLEWGAVAFSESRHCGIFIKKHVDR